MGTKISHRWGEFLQGKIYVKFLETHLIPPAVGDKNRESGQFSLPTRSNSALGEARKHRLYMGVCETCNFGEFDEFSPIKGLYPQFFASYPQKNIGGLCRGCLDMGDRKQ